MCTIYKNIQYVPNMYIKSVYFSVFILHILGTDRCKIGVGYIIFQPVYIIPKIEAICSKIHDDFINFDLICENSKL
jgi:hypothetical protein